MSAHTTKHQIPDSQIALLLESRYGDGPVYLPKQQTRSVYTEARTRGFIDAEGYLTRKGRTLVARYKYL